MFNTQVPIGTTSVKTEAVYSFIDLIHEPSATAIRALAFGRIRETTSSGSSTPTGWGVWAERSTPARPHGPRPPDGPFDSAFCPAYDIEDSPQQIRIVIDGMSGYIPTALVALTLDGAERLCDRLNARLGLDRNAAGPPLPGVPCAATASRRTAACIGPPPGHCFAGRKAQLAAHWPRRRKPQVIQTGRLIAAA